MRNDLCHFLLANVMTIETRVTRFPDSIHKKATMRSTERRKTMSGFCLRPQLFTYLAMTWLVAAVHPATAADPVEPASVEQAVKVLDLRTLELPQGAAPAEMRQVSSVTYEIKIDPKMAFQIQQQQLIKLGWK